MPFPLVPLALGAGGLFLLTKMVKPKASPGMDVDAGIQTGVAAATHVTGRSGTQWDVQMVEAPTQPLSNGGSAVMQVILNDPKIPARRHMVINYMQTGAGTPPSRSLVRTGPSTPGLIQSAIADFGVTGPAAEAASQGKT